MQCRYRRGQDVQERSGSLSEQQTPAQERRGTEEEAEISFFFDVVRQVPISGLDEDDAACNTC